MASGAKWKDRAHPVQQLDRFDQWVERACFQYHPPVKDEPSMAPAKRFTGPVAPRPPAFAVPLPAHASTQPQRVARKDFHPQLTASTDSLFCHQTAGNLPVTVHAAPSSTTRVINMLLRVVHGGSTGTMQRVTVYIPDYKNDPFLSYPDDCYPRQYSKASVDLQHDDKPSRKDKRRSKDVESDRWEWKRLQKHWFVFTTSPEGKMFVPKEADYVPCKLRWICDDRETYQVFQSSERTIADSWRLMGNNVEKTNRRNEYWTGTTTFTVLFHPANSQEQENDSDVEDKVSGPNSVVTCKFPEGINLIPLDRMFIVQDYKLKHETRTQAYWDIRLVLHRNNGKEIV